MRRPVSLHNKSVLFWLRLFGVIVLVSFGLSGWTVLQQSHAAAEREQDRRSANVAAVSQCFQSVQNAPQVVKILGLIDTLAFNSIEANRLALQLSADTDPLAPVRRSSLQRLVPARKELRAFISRVNKNIPRRSECVALADANGLNAKEIEKGVK